MLTPVGKWGFDINRRIIELVNKVFLGLGRFISFLLKLSVNRVGLRMVCYMLYAVSEFIVLP
jgi:hypothetical protein